MAERLGPGLKRGWTPSPVRAALRVAQMNLRRRVREAERSVFFWELVEMRGLRLEQLTTRVRRDLVSQAKEIQQWFDSYPELGRAQSTTGAASEAPVVVSAPVPAGVVPLLAGGRPPVGLTLPRSRPGWGWGGKLASMCPRRKRRPDPSRGAPSKRDSEPIVAGGEAEGKQRAVLPALLLGEPGVGVPPAALWPIVRCRLLMLECEAVLWEVAVALLVVPPWQWRDYRVVLRNVPVPGSACTSQDFGTVMREWWALSECMHPDVRTLTVYPIPFTSPAVPLWPLWPPALLFALVGFVEATEGACWAVAILRGFCRQQMALVAPPGRRRGRPPYETRRRAEDFVVAWERAHHRDRQGRLDGRVCWPRVHQHLGLLGCSDVGDCGTTPPEEKLRTKYARRQRTQTQSRGSGLGRPATFSSNHFCHGDWTRRLRLSRRHEAESTEAPKSGVGAAPRRRRGRHPHP